MNSIPRKGYYNIVIREDRASVEGVRQGQIVYYGSDMFGLANDNSRITGVQHAAFSHNESGIPFFTMPKHDVRPPSIFAGAGIPNHPLTKLTRTGVNDETR